MNKKNKFNRSVFLKWFKGILGILFVGFIFKKPRIKPVTKMLTQDGFLVEIKPNAFYRKGSKIKKDEIHNWIKN